MKKFVQFGTISIHLASKRFQCILKNSLFGVDVDDGVIASYFVNDNFARPLLSTVTNIDLLLTSIL